MLSAWNRHASNQVEDIKLAVYHVDQDRLIRSTWSNKVDKINLIRYQGDLIKLIKLMKIKYTGKI